MTALLSVIWQTIGLLFGLAILCGLGVIACEFAMHHLRRLRAKLKRWAME